MSLNYAGTNVTILDISGGQLGFGNHRLAEVALEQAVTQFMRSPEFAKTKGSLTSELLVKIKFDVVTVMP